MELLHRPRRLRISEAVREMARETRLSKKALVYPVFIREGSGIREEIPSLPGQYHYSPDTICEEMERLVKAGINKILLFGIPAHKDEMGSSAWDDNGAVQQAIREIKKNFPQIYCITDVCMCEYTSHGHCGVLDACTTVNNDKTLELLCKVSLSHVRAGADMVAPSDMMDGRVLAIRHALDSEGFTHIPIMAYSAKYASAFYGPFRDAAGSAPSFGDRRSYQMDIHNRKEALKEIDSDVEEGADIVMVKLSGHYLAGFPAHHPAVGGLQRQRRVRDDRIRGQGGPHRPRPHHRRGGGQHLPRGCGYSDHLSCQGHRPSDRRGKNRLSFKKESGGTGCGRYI